MDVILLLFVMSLDVHGVLLFPADISDKHLQCYTRLPFTCQAVHYTVGYLMG